MGQGFLRCIVIKAAQVLEWGSIAELVLVLQGEGMERKRRRGHEHSTSEKLKSVLENSYILIGTKSLLLSINSFQWTIDFSEQRAISHMWCSLTPPINWTKIVSQFQVVIALMNIIFQTSVNHSPGHIKSPPMEHVSSLYIPDLFYNYLLICDN